MKKEKRLFMGYKMAGMDPEHTEVVLHDMFNAVQRTAHREYRRLLTREIQRMTDEVVIGAVQRPDISLYDMSCRIMDSKITAASSRNQPTEYNLDAGVHVLFYQGDTYFKIDTANPIYDSAFGSISGIMPFHCEGDNQKTWELIAAQYHDLAPLGVRMSPVIKPVDPSNMKFDPPSVRAAVIARHDVTNEYIRAVTNGEIHDYEFMDNIDDALNHLTAPAQKSRIEDIEIQLRAVLPVITTEMITADPKDQHLITKKDGAD